MFFRPKKWIFFERQPLFRTGVVRTGWFRPPRKPPPKITPAGPAGVGTRVFQVLRGVGVVFGGGKITPQDHPGSTPRVDWGDLAGVARSSPLSTFHPAHTPPQPKEWGGVIWAG